ncbi:CHAD domain-containing protein [Saccharicrinis carchari]|uniref:CHAD domain-containing protein n=1 Tax=Saccharicrinis carchari TaxID=1168039 RepID=A0A521D3L6_SACCC|nr:CHAD domain-containing protein [Saccharicrinis carchari]SMO66264.1 CHAD domain-containing protein [Saccharicrinis carchari]
MKGLGRHAGILLTSFRANILKSNLDADMNDIHNLRLDLKQLFALIKLLKWCKVQLPDGFGESLAVKTLFKLTGIVRDNQLSIAYGQEILPYKTHKELKRKACKNTQQARKQIATALQGIDLDKVQTDLALAFKETTYLKTTDMLYQLKNKIQKDESSIIAELEHNECDYHRIRRRVKEQYYLLTVIKNVLGENINPKIINTKKQQAKALGKWHDWVVFEKNIRNIEVAPDDKIYALLQHKRQNILKNIQIP